MLPQAAVSYQRSQRLLAITLAAVARRQWAGMGDDFDATWPTVRSRLVAVTTMGQMAAARLAEPYLHDVLAETGQPDAPVARLVTPTFAGTASDGRGLPGFLDGAVVAAKRARSEMDTNAALAVGGRWLEMASETMVADTARSAVITGITVRVAIDGYVRVTGGDPCSRCAVLAGKFYRFSTGFFRHPRCHCFHVPATRGRSRDFIEDETGKVHASDLSSLTIAANSTEGRAMPEQLIAAARTREDAIAALRHAKFAA